MSAESAVMGLRRGWLGMAMSMMTTLFCGEVCTVYAGAISWNSFAAPGIQ
jgi:hypothetical protein